MSQRVLPAQQLPVITLFGVNPSDVLAKYRQGYFANVTLPKINFQFVVQETAVIKPVYSSDPSQASFSFHKRSGVEVVFLTSNQDLYAETPVDSRRSRLLCDWCRTETREDRVGNPFMVTTEYDIQGKMKLIFICDCCCYCDESCGLAHYLDTCGGTRRHSVSRRSVESLIHTLWYLRHPGAPPLRPAADYHLLDTNGGDLSYEQYKGQRYTYVQNPSYVIQHAKNLYQRLP